MRIRLRFRLFLLRKKKRKHRVLVPKRGLQENPDPNAACRRKD